MATDQRVPNYAARSAWGACLAAALMMIFADRSTASPYSHVLVLSIDGLREADLEDPVLAPLIPNIRAFAQSGIQYTEARSVAPSDSFPTTLALFTGASPKTTGVYYDDTYNRALYGPFTNISGTPGTEVPWNSTIDIDPQSLTGGANSDASSLNVGKLPQVNIGGTLQPVYPHDYLKVNTVFELAHEAGLRTAYIEKHPSYEILNGPSGQGLSDFYAPESDARVQIVDGQLVNGGSKISKSVPLALAYDDLRVQALSNQISGLDSRGDMLVGAPAIFGMNFIGVNTAEKLTNNTGGITLNAQNHEVVGSGMQSALQHTDATFGQLLDQLQANGIADSTLVVLTAKTGSNPRVGAAKNVSALYIPQTLDVAGIPVSFALQDDVALIWLKDQSQVSDAAEIVQSLDPTVVESVLSGSSLIDAGFADPLHDDRAPDLVVKLQDGVVIATDKRAEHGGFSEDDVHVPLVLGSNALPDALRGILVTDPVNQQQVAVTILQALGLDPSKLQGAVSEGTQGLPLAVPEPPAAFLITLAAVVLMVRRCRVTSGGRLRRECV